MRKNSTTREKTLAKKQELAKEYSAEPRVSKSKPSGKISLGSSDIYIEQVTCAKNVMSILKNEDIIPTICSEFQQGKTGAMIYLTYLYTMWQKSLKNDYHIFILINIGNNVLRDQTKDRFEKADLLPTHFIPGGGSNISIIHHSELRSATAMVDKLRRKNKKMLLIVDESHVAQGSDKPFDNFLKKLGVKWGQYPSEWRRDDIKVVSVSATAFSEEMLNRVNSFRSERDPSAFKNVILERNPNYYSLEHMLNAGRIFQTERVILGDTVTDFFCERLNELKRRCRGNNGYMILRVKSSNDAILIANYIYDTYGENVLCNIYDTKSKDKNIKQISEDLKVKPKKPFVMIIEGAIKTGETLSTSRNIRIWVEMNSINADTTGQSVGRSTGYSEKYDRENPINGKIHSKFDDTYPIYCNKASIIDTIEWYKDRAHNSIPSGANNKTSNGIVGSDYHIILNTISDGTKEADDLAKEELNKLFIGKNSIIPDMIRIKKEKLGLKDKDRVYKDYMHLTVTKISRTKNLIGDWAYVFDNHQSRGNTDKLTDGAIGNRMVLFDSLCKNPDKEIAKIHKKSWNSLMAKHPEYEGRYVYSISEELLNILRTKNKRGLSKYTIVSPTSTTNIIDVDRYKLKKRSTYEKAIIK